MNRLLQLYQTLGFTTDNGLFFLDEYDRWIHRFPYRISRLIKEVIKPSAFFCIFGNLDVNDEHPLPFNKSFVFFFDNPTAEEERYIHKHIINFSLAQLVFINRTNTLDLYHGNDIDGNTLKLLIHNGAENSFQEYSFINQLNGRVYAKLGKKGKSIDLLLLDNITDARRILVAKDGLNLLPKAANRLIGRLLFIGYLIDRDVTFSDQNIITGANKRDRKESFKSVIANKKLIYEFFKYLTNKHNGEIFPLEETATNGLQYDECELVKEEHLEVLSHLFNCSSFFKNGEKFNAYTVQKSFFDLYDFEVIPVEFISSIYENFIGNKSENENLNISKQEAIKAYYTPSYIVDYILSQTITPFLEDKNKTNSNCRVLDPSCGSGIFLVETLRKIIEKEMILTKAPVSDARLWELIKANIYGIDIDADAIDITIFSLYVTILDYKKPAEIEKFKFLNLKNSNLFGGIDADFFNTEHIYNTKIRDLNFIIGNPPWGKVNKSKYIEYINKRNIEENKTATDKVTLQIGGKEICQAFLVRTSDFSTEVPLKCSFVITSKILYNSDSKLFRNYFSQKFVINQVLELSPINNKIRGGNQVFDSARYPASIITYEISKSHQNILNNIVQHITVKPNIFFLCYKTIVIEKHDVKYIKQSFFIPKFGGYDWLWKTLVFGNHLDFQLINRLKNQYKTVKEQGFDNYKGGFKIIDGVKKMKNPQMLDFLFLDAKIGFRPYFVNASHTWKKEIELNIESKNQEELQNGIVGYMPDLQFFKGPRLLFKKGAVLNPELGEHSFGAVTAYNNSDMCYTSTVASLLPPESMNDPILALNELAALFNSKLFTYYVLNTGPSLGVEKSRYNFEDFLNFPIIRNKEIGELAQLILEHKNDITTVNNLKQQIEHKIIEIYSITDTERDLIDYAMTISIPTLLRENENNLSSLNFSNENDYAYIQNYINIFIKKFKHRFAHVGKKLMPEIIFSENFLRINFNIQPLDIFGVMTPKEIDKNNLAHILGDLSLYQVSSELFMQQDVRGFTSTSFYIIKPNERKVWHSAVAHVDAYEFEEEIVKTEIKLMQNK